MGSRVGQILALAVAVLAAGVAVALWVVRRANGDSRSDHQGGSPAPDAGGKPASWPLSTVRGSDTVRSRLSSHKDEFLCYELGMEMHRRRASRSDLDRLLDGREPVLAAPVLNLSVDGILWRQGELRVAVDLALDDLGIAHDGRDGEPTSGASAAIQSWARIEAARKFDVFAAGLGGPA
jgi:hypothetical protein